MKKLRWGIVSTGRIAEQFTSDMRFVENGEVVAVAARKLVDAKAFADKHSITTAYGDYQQLFDDPNVNIVYIGTPHTAHFEQARKAILAGKHVLCEKPITVSTEQARHLTSLAKSKQVYLMEAMWTYFLPAILKAKAWVAEGKIGEIKHIKADFGYPIPFNAEGREYNKELAGGCLLDMGIYPIAIAAYFLNRDIGFLHVNSHLAPNGVEDDVIMLAEFGSVKATLSTSFQCKLNNWAYIIGDKGTIAIKDFWRADACALYVLDEEVERFEDKRESLGFNFEALAVGNDIAAGKLESDVVTHKRSLWLQQQMERVRGFF